ncbi:SDR family NAD(P)-dependent oxidoreductase [Clostridium pasteurianum]|nr:SDR family NAD(P)-dependent oxidoreductase [Clostridium pasteurianum]
MVYGATKAFILSFTEALRYEIRQSDIMVSCLCLGDTKTNFFCKYGYYV